MSRALFRKGCCVLGRSLSQAEQVEDVRALSTMRPADIADPERRAAAAELQQLAATYRPMFDQAKARLRPDGSLALSDVQTLPEWPAFVADLKAIRDRHPSAFASSSSGGGALVAGLALVALGAAFLGARR